MHDNPFLYAIYIARYVNQHIMPVGESDYEQAYMCMYGKTAVLEMRVRAVCVAGLQIV